MPYSWCTTRSPSAISVASAMNWSARLRRRGGREMRSPSRSCSPTTARRSAPKLATKPRSIPSVTSETVPGLRRRTSDQVSSCWTSFTPCSRSRWAMRSREPRVQAAMTSRLPSLFQRSAWPRSCSKICAPAPATFCANTGPGRPLPSTPTASSGLAKGLKAKVGLADSMAFQAVRSRYSRSAGSGRYGTSPSRGTILRAAKWSAIISNRAVSTSSPWWSRLVAAPGR